MAALLKPDSVTGIDGIPTPFYYYDIDLLKRTLEELSSAAGKYSYMVHYALKANADNRILEIIRDFGIGADCVSGNEVLKAVEIGFDPADIYYAGVGKTDKEIISSLENKIGCFNCESLQEIQVINEKAGRLGVTAPVALRINPDVESHTHKYITTGKTENKFGIQSAELEELTGIIEGLENISLEGIHFHVGSQITDLEVYKNLCHKANECNRMFEGRGIRLKSINLGGGLGIDYNEPHINPLVNFERFFAVVNESLEPLSGQKVHFELGRSVVAQMGSLITKVIYTKKAATKSFVVVDAAMTELIRPALYNAFHRVVNLVRPMDETEKYDVVGPVCETSDFFARDIQLPHTERGDLLAIRSAGAYAQSMSMNYNLRDKAGVVYSDHI